MEAIKTLPTNFTPAEVKLIMSRVNPRLYSQLKETFLVIDDDMERVNTRSRDQLDQASGPPATGSNSEALGSRSRGSKRQSDAPVGAGTRSKR